MGCCTSRSGGFQSGRADGGGRDRGTQGFKPPRWKSTDPITDSELKVRTPRLPHRDDLRPPSSAMPPLPPLLAACVLQHVASPRGERIYSCMCSTCKTGVPRCVRPVINTDLVMHAWRSVSGRSSGTQPLTTAATEVSSDADRCWTRYAADTAALHAGLL